MKSFFKILLALLSSYILIFIFFLLIIAAFSDTEPLIDDNSYLYMSIGGSIPEYVAPNPFEQLTGTGSLDLRKIRENLEKAAVDDRINGVVLNIGFLQTGFAKIQELQKLIDTYKQSGKKIYAFLEFALTREYLVAIACDSVFIPANSNLFLTGIAGEATFYKGLFDKIGVEADFVYVGEYKNAPDQYTRESMSQYHKEALDLVFNQFYDFIINNIAERRNLSREVVESYINDISGFTGRDAVRHNLIDGNLFKDDIVKHLNLHNEIPTRVNGITYAAVPISSLDIRNKSRIAVIHITGTISSGNDVNDPFLGKLAGSNTIVTDIQNASRSSTIKAIIIRIDSPGGSAIASEIIWDAIKKARQKKPVIASISDYGASGGYYLAMAADTIITDPMSLIGSIGIFAGKFSIGKLYNKIGINFERIQRGDNSGLFSTNTIWSDSERKIMRRLLQDYYDDFVTKVAESRKMTFEEIDKISRGRVWTGRNGLENGLVDSYGTFYDALAIAQKMAKIDSSVSARLSYYPKEKGFFTELYSLISLKLNAFNIFNETEFTFITQFQNHPLALMPFILKWN